MRTNSSDLGHERIFRFSDLALTTKATKIKSHNDTCATKWQNNIIIISFLGRPLIGPDWDWAEDAPANFEGRGVDSKIVARCDGGRNQKIALRLTQIIITWQKVRKIYTIVVGSYLMEIYTYIFLNKYILWGRLTSFSLSSLSLLDDSFWRSGSSSCDENKRNLSTFLITRLISVQMGIVGKPNG